jgi:hypothetical protein
LETGTPETQPITASRLCTQLFFSSLGVLGDSVVKNGSLVPARSIFPFGATMTISSCTPEGEPNACPICGNQIRIEPSRPVGVAPCPHCGTLLWFVATERSTRFFDPKTVHLARIHELGLDSLELVELVMEIELR